MSYGGGAKCAVCDKAVYHNDPKISDSGKTWHAACFRCKECKECITLAKWAQLDGENFCKPCYKKVFMLRGKYSDVGGSAPTFAGSTGTASAGEGGAGESAAAAPAAPAATAPAAAKAPSPAPKPTGTPAPAGEVKFGGGAKCPVCTKSVYAAEPSVAADGNKFHAACFRCLECKTQLTMAKWAQLEGKNYCKVCFNKVFSLRGKYDDLRSGVHVPGANAAAAAAAGGATTSSTAAAAEEVAAPVAPPAPAAEEKKVEKEEVVPAAEAAPAVVAVEEVEKPAAEEEAPVVAAE